MKQYYIVIVQHYNFPECTLGRVEIVDKVLMPKRSGKPNLRNTTTNAGFASNR